MITRTKLKSPYEYINGDYTSRHDWETITYELVNKFPYKDIVLSSIFTAFDQFGDILKGKPLEEKWNISIPFGKFIDLKGGPLSTIIEQLYAYNLNEQTRGFWRGGIADHSEKDVVCELNLNLDHEVKITSLTNEIPGSKTYLGIGEKQTKFRDGYYLVGEYDATTMRVRRVRLGWLNDCDWTVSKSPKSGGARVTSKIQELRFIDLYKYSNAFFS